MDFCKLGSIFGFQPAFTNATNVHHIILEHSNNTRRFVAQRTCIVTADRYFPVTSTFSYIRFFETRSVFLSTLSLTCLRTGQKKDDEL